MTTNTHLLHPPVLSNRLECAAKLGMAIFMLTESWISQCNCWRESLQRQIIILELICSKDISMPRSFLGNVRHKRLKRLRKNWPRSILPSDRFPILRLQQALDRKSTRLNSSHL